MAAPVIFNYNTVSTAKKDNVARIALAVPAKSLNWYKPAAQLITATIYKNEESNMTRIFCFVLTILFITSTESFATDFINGFEDVPLMAGLRQETNQDFTFGNEESGYTETLLVATKLKKFDEVKRFYNDILPKFGWTLVKESDSTLNFTRDDDILDISRQQIRPLKVLISLKSEN